MSVQLVIRSEADAEMMDAAEWYEKRREGLGREFLEEIERGLIEIQLHPKRFPIIAVYHGSRDPKRWMGRLK